MANTIITIILAFLFGLVIGSFLNVCIYRIPKEEDIVFTRSHCMSCGHTLQWYELIPVLSYLMQRGRCRSCNEPISIQYPFVELLNAAGYVWIFLLSGSVRTKIVSCLFTSILIVISFIDAAIMEIPAGCNILVVGLGIFQLIFNRSQWLNYVIGAVCVSGLLLVLYLITRGKGIGGGDIKFMAASGLLLGAVRICIGFFLGCVLATVIHLIRMKLSHADHKLAFGPYLSIGMWIAMLYGEPIMNWYLGTL